MAIWVRKLSLKSSSGWLAFEDALTTGSKGPARIAMGLLRACVAPPPDEGVALSIVGIFALGGGCYDNDKRHRKGGYHHKSHKKDYDDDYSKSRYHRSYKCYDCDDDDGLLSGIL